MATFVAVWVIVVILIVVLAMWAGWIRGKSLLAVFIDTRNTGSLAQFQLGVWILALIPLMFAAIWERATASPSTALAMMFDSSFWTVLGISVTSTVAATAIKSQKNEADAGSLSAANRILARKPRIDANGKVTRREFHFFDMLAYDEGKQALLGLDITKFQNLLFTVGFAITYVYITFQMYAKTSDPSSITSLPAINGTLLGLMGLSQAGYVAAKAVPQSGVPDPTKPETANTQLAKDLFAA